jgi:hypothetical protein
MQQACASRRSRLQWCLRDAVTVGFCSLLGTIESLSKKTTPSPSLLLVRAAQPRLSASLRFRPEANEGDNLKGAS